MTSLIRKSRWMRRGESLASYAIDIILIIRLYHSATILPVAKISTKNFHNELANLITQPLQVHELTNTLPHKATKITHAHDLPNNSIKILPANLWHKIIYIAYM